MDNSESLPIQPKELQKRHISYAIRIIGIRKIKENLILEALVSAHRDRYEPYVSDGNREISGIGHTALIACIKYGQTKEEWKSRVQVWEKLTAQRNLLQIATSSGLIPCIAASIRQSGLPLASQAPLSKRVIAYALQGLIGAVYLSFERDRETTCRAIDNLSQYLETDNARHLSADFDLNMDLDVIDSNELLSWRDYVSTEDQTDEGSGYRDHNTHGLGLEPDFDPHDFTTMPSLDPSTNPTDFDLLSGLQNISLAHASDQGRQRFFLTATQPVEELSEHPIEEPGPADNPNAKPKKPIVRSTMKKKIDEYVHGQEQLRTGLTSAQDVLWSPAMETSINMLSVSSKHQATLRKLYHGSVSALAIIRIKNALMARRSATTLVAGPSERLDSPTYHYRQLYRGTNTQAQITIKNMFHTYMLYFTLRGDFKSAFDDGFIHSDVQSLLLSSNVEGAAEPGNPITKNLSREYNNMLHYAESGWDFMSEEEQSHLKSYMIKLRKLGERFHAFLKFGIGILCLLLLSSTGNTEHGILTITEAEFCSLPESKKRELHSLIEIMSQRNHPIARFAETAGPILIYLVDESLPSPGRFRCENTEITKLAGIPEGSMELLAELDNIGHSAGM